MQKRANLLQPFEAEHVINNIYKFGLFLEESAMLRDYRVHFVNPIWINIFFWKSCVTAYEGVDWIRLYLDAILWWTQQKASNYRFLRKPFLRGS